MSPVAQSRTHLQAALRRAVEAHSVNQSPTTLEALIHAYKQFIVVLDETLVEHGNAVLDLAKLLGERWAKTRSGADWAEAESLIDDFRARIPRSDWREPLYVLAQGVLRYQRADATGLPEDAVDAAGRLEEARAEVRANSFVYNLSCTFLADLRLRRFEADGNPIDLEAALRDAADILEADRAFPWQIVWAAKIFARAATLHAEATETGTYLDVAVQQARRALSLSRDEAQSTDLHAALASTLRARFQRDRNMADIDGAIASYNAALVPPGLPDDIRAARLDNLANGLADRYAVRPEDADLDLMIDSGRNALALWSLDSPKRALTCANFASTLLAQWRTRRELNVLAEARHIIESGLGIEDTPLALKFRLYGQLLGACLELDAAETGNYLDRAIKAGKIALGLSGLSEQDSPVIYRLAAHARWSKIARRLAGALVLRAQRDGRLHDADLRWAVAAGEATKAPILTRALLRRTLPPPAGASEGDLFFERQVLAEIAVHDTHDIVPPSAVSDKRFLRRMARRRSCWIALQRVWDDIAATGPEGEQYVGMRRDLPAALGAALERPPEGWLLLSILETEALSPAGDWQSGFCIIALPPGAGRPTVLCSGTSEQIQETQNLFVEQVLNVANISSGSETWWRAFGSLLKGKQANAEFQIMVSATARSLNLPWQLLLERSGWRSTEGTVPPVTVVPTLVLAAIQEADNHEGWHVVRNAAEHFGLPDFPDVAESVRVGMPLPTAPTRQAAIVGDPLADLTEASDEAVVLGRMFEVEPLTRERANRKSVREAFRSARLVHIAAHASFDADDPLSSVLHLADGDVSARDLVGTWSTSELVVLSACESGAGAPILGDEVLGLAAELLRSGVRSVVASIWPVDDAATAFLMESFHAARMKGLSNARALAKAMSATRSEPGWSRPYYWAGFVLVQPHDVRESLYGSA